MAVPSYSSRTNASAASNGVNTAMSDESILQQESLDDIDSLPHKNVLKLKSSDSVSVMKKRGSFQITSVVVAKSNHTEDLDSFDDLDETHTEEMSSEIGDTSKITDIDVDPSSTEEITASATTPTEAEDVFQQSKTLPDTDVINKVHSNNDIHSRFKLVKIESKEPFVRGRWTCLDYRNPPTEKSLEKSLEDAGSGNSSTTSSINYVHGIDDPLKDPLLTTLVADGHSIIEPQPIHPGNSQLRNNEFLSANLAATTQSNTLTHSTTQAQSSVSQSVLSTPSAVLNPHSQNTTLAPVPSNTVITEQASDYISSGQEPYISSQGQEYIPQPEYATHHPAVSIGGDISQSTSQSQIDTHPQAVPSDYSASQQGSTLNGASISDFNKSLEAVTALNSAKLSVPAASIATQGNAANSSSPSNDNPENKEISADYVQNAIPEVGDEIEESGEDDDSDSTGSSSDETDSKSVVAHQITAPPTGHSFLAPPLLEMVATMQPGSQLANKENGDERYKYYN